MKIFFGTRFWITGICLGSWLCITSCSIDNDPYDASFTLEPFDTLTLNSVFDVVLQQGDHFGIEISGVREVAGSVTYQIVNRTLLIENEDGALWKHPELDPPLLTI